MKKVILLCLSLFVCASHALAFNPDPTQYEYIGQKTDGCGLFYEIATAKADGQKGMFVMLQADPKNRTLRYYRDVVIDPETKTMRTKFCELYDYRGVLLESFALPDEAVSYSSGDLTDKIYQDLLAKGIVEKPEPKVVVSDVPSSTPSYTPDYQAPVTRGGWQEGFSGGNEEIIDLPIDSYDGTIADF